MMAPALLIAKIPSLFPDVIANKVGVSPVVATVITAALLAASSARLAVWPFVIVTAASVTVIATVSVVAAFVPSDTEIVSVYEVKVS